MHIPLMPGDTPTKTYIKERISLAYQIIVGVPEKQIELDAWYSRIGKEVVGKKRCNTLACGAGWLALHPAFNALGLERNGSVVDGGYYALNSVFLHEPNNYRVMRHAENLFGQRDSGDWDWYLVDLDHNITDKELLLWRLKYGHDHHSG